MHPKRVQSGYKMTRVAIVHGNITKIAGRMMWAQRKSQNWSTDRLLTARLSAKVVANAAKKQRPVSSWLISLDPTECEFVLDKVDILIQTDRRHLPGFMMAWNWSANSFGGHTYLYQMHSLLKRHSMENLWVRKESLTELNFYWSIEKQTELLTEMNESYEECTLLRLEETRRSLKARLLRLKVNGKVSLKFLKPEANRNLSGSRC